MIDAAARTGMSEREFWECTPAYFFARVKHHGAEIRESWEQARFMAYVTAKTVDSKKRLKKPADLLPFPWDAPVKRFKKLTAAERKEQEDFDKEADLIMQKYQPEAWANILEQREKEAVKNGG
jgi:hypothetical protein